ncbi:DUF7092 domain-containing protein [Roseateles sp. BYS87W]|uniref:DUF7092 domain-containing protein n=1 Tax=Pelomonas baiyunensis TaxID=3299026 RepID=A0ABW7H1B7_9BURK
MLRARWFSAPNATAVVVEVRLQDGWLQYGDRLVSLRQVHWPARRGRGARRLGLRQGGWLQFDDAAAFDAWAAACGQGEAPVSCLVRLVQRSARWVGLH